jgi:8-oxo-dGTP pyrophosphatase MutT (NUDIX family)
MLSVERIRAALATYQPADADAAGLRTAAVAAILREPSSATEILFIHRAEHPQDPWSGHMAFPGGRVEPGDADALAAAIRETREETGVDLQATASAIGRLAAVPAVARGVRVGMVILPFVFALHHTPVLQLSSEVQEVVWVPLAFLAEPGNRSSLVWHHGGAAVTLPCYRYQGHTIWGLTLRMVDEILGLAKYSSP